MNFPDAYVEELRTKRHETIKRVWSKFHVNKENFALSPLLIDSVIEQYIKDLCILKFRYNIENKAQLHKVAGLMTSSLLKYRPILPCAMKYNIPRQVYTNEIFAIYHGISICGGLYSDEDIRKVMNLPEVAKLLEGLIFLLHYRNYTSEAVSSFYESLAVHYFPKNFESPHNDEAGD